MVGKIVKITNEKERGKEMRQFKIIKRSGEEKDFDITKIENAIRAASNTVDPVNALSEDRIVSSPRRSPASARRATER